MGKSEIEAKPLVVQQRQESLLDRQDVYIRVFFSILRNGGRGGSKMDNEYAVAESIDLHHIYGTNDQSFDENCIIQTTLIYDCNDLLIDDSGQCNDPEGEFGIIMNALNEVENFVLGLKDRMPKANIYLYIYGFEQVDEIVRSFSYLVDSDNSLGVGFVNEELLSNVMQVTPLSDYYLKTGYLFYVNYVGEYQYYQVYQPLIGGVEINVEPIKPTKISNSTLSMSISDYSSARQDTRTLYGHVEKTDIDILNTTQLVLDVASIMPVIGEVSSLVNGFIYLGREFNLDITNLKKSFNKKYKVYTNSINKIKEIKHKNLFCNNNAFGYKINLDKNYNDSDNDDIYNFNSQLSDLKSKNALKTFYNNKAKDKLEKKLDLEKQLIELQNKFSYIIEQEKAEKNRLGINYGEINQIIQKKFLYREIYELDRNQKKKQFFDEQAKILYKTRNYIQNKVVKEHLKQKTINKFKDIIGVHFS